MRIPLIPPGGLRLKFGEASEAPRDYICFSDGSVKRAKASAAFVIYDAGKDVLVTKKGWTLPYLTRDSNVAELNALVMALEAAKELKARHLLCLTDSYQVLQFLEKACTGQSGKYPDMTLLIKAIKNFESVVFQNIQRSKNKDADYLCKGFR